MDFGAEKLFNVMNVDKPKKRAKEDVRRIDMDKQGLKKVYCKDCEYVFGEYSCSYESKQEGKYTGSHVLEIQNRKILNHIGNCNKYKRKWYLFWR